MHRARELAVSGAQCEMAAQGAVCVTVLLYIGVTGVVPSSSGKSSHSLIYSGSISDFSLL